MKKRLLFITLALCGSMGLAQEPVTTTVEVKTPEMDPSDTQNKHRLVVERAQELLQKVVREDAFAEKVRAATFGGGSFFRRVDGVVTQPSAGEVLRIIREGVERNANNTGDKRIEIILKPKPQPKGVVGSTRLGSNPVRTATWFMQQVAERRDATSLARHLLHEWMHVAGFFHKGRGPNQKDVPYVIGDIVRDVAQNDLKRKLALDKSNILNNYMTEDDLALLYLEEADDDVEFYAPADDAPLVASVKFLRSQAEKCKALARSASKPADRNILQSMAVEFEQRAAKLEAGQEP